MLLLGTKCIPQHSHCTQSSAAAYLQRKSCRYKHTRGEVQKDTAQHDTGLFQRVIAVCAPSVLGVNAPTSDSRITFC